MTNFLELLVDYLASKLSLTAGTEIFYNELPEKPNKGVVIQEIQTGHYSVPPQVNAEVHRIEVTVREATYSAAAALAQDCYRWLLTDEDSYSSLNQSDTTGAVNLTDVDIVHVTLYGNPVWKRTDQQGRKLYHFFASIITRR